MVDLVGDDTTEEFGESELNGVGIFEGQAVKGDGGAFGLAVADAMGVEVTEGGVAEGGGSALTLMCWQLPLHFASVGMTE